MDLGLTGKKAIVTGGSRGMGRAAAEALAAEGVAVTIVARKHDSLERAVAEIALRTGATITPVAGDITTPVGRAAALAACPGPDILVNNADGLPPAEFRSLTRDDWIAGLDAMMLTPIEMMRLTVDGMMERGFGRIVNIMSRSVKVAQPEMPQSNGARSGLAGFVAGLSRQTVARNVTINNILPGIVASGAQKQHVAVLAETSGRPFEEVWRERQAQNPAGRYGEPEEIGAWIAFLCSRHSGFVTGQSILIDGGQYPGTF